MMFPHPAVLQFVLLLVLVSLHCAAWGPRAVQGATVSGTTGFRDATIGEEPDADWLDISDAANGMAGNWATSASRRQEGEFFNRVRVRGFGFSGTDLPGMSTIQETRPRIWAGQGSENDADVFWSSVTVASGTQTTVTGPAADPFTEQNVMRDRTLASGTWGWAGPLVLGRSVFNPAFRFDVVLGAQRAADGQTDDVTALFGRAAIELRWDLQFDVTGFDRSSVPATGGVPLLVLGATFDRIPDGSGGLLGARARVGTTVVNAEVSNSTVVTIASMPNIGCGEGADVPVEVSLDAGTTWTTNGLTIELAGCSTTGTTGTTGSTAGTSGTTDTTGTTNVPSSTGTTGLSTGTTGTPPVGSPAPSSPPPSSPAGAGEGDDDDDDTGDNLPLPLWLIIVLAASVCCLLLLCLGAAVFRSRRRKDPVPQPEYTESSTMYEEEEEEIEESTFDDDDDDDDGDEEVVYADLAAFAE